MSETSWDRLCAGCVLWAGGKWHSIETCRPLSHAGNLMLPQSHAGNLQSRAISCSCSCSNPCWPLFNACCIRPTRRLLRRRPQPSSQVWQSCRGPCRSWRSRWRWVCVSRCMCMWECVPRECVPAWIMGAPGPREAVLFTAAQGLRGA